MYADDKKNFKGLFFQDVLMTDAFQAYAEIVFVDAIHKLLELGVPTYLFQCEDLNGQSEIVGVCLLVCEDAESMRWMIGTFKKCNREWQRIGVVTVST